MEYSRLYARELRTSRKLAGWAERHQGIINAAIIIEALAAACYVFMYV